MSEQQSLFEQECESIRQERSSYKLGRPKGVVKFMDILSAIFWFSGFIALALIPFTEVTLLQATCLFVIHYTIAPSEVDMAQGVIKGMAEDLGCIRANLATIRRKNDENL